MVDPDEAPRQVVDSEDESFNGIESAVECPELVRVGNQEFDRTHNHVADEVDNNTHPEVDKDPHRGDFLPAARVDNRNPLHDQHLHDGGST